MVIKDYYYHDYIQSNGKDFSCYKGIQRHLFMEISCSGKTCPPMVFNFSHVWS